MTTLQIICFGIFCFGIGYGVGVKVEAALDYRAWTRVFNKNWAMLIQFEKDRLAKGDK